MLFLDNKRKSVYCPLQPYRVIISFLQFVNTLQICVTKILNKKHGQDVVFIIGCIYSASECICAPPKSGLDVFSGSGHNFFSLALAVILFITAAISL